MSDFFKELRTKVPEVTSEMIIETIIDDWEEYHEELGLNHFATSKRIIAELGSLLENPSFKFLAYSRLFEINKGNFEENSELFEFLIKGILSPIKLDTTHLEFSRLNLKLDIEGFQKIIDEFDKMGLLSNNFESNLENS